MENLFPSPHHQHLVIPHYSRTLQKIQKLSLGCTALSGRASHCIRLMLVTPSVAAVALSAVAADEDDSVSSLPEEVEEGVTEV